MFNTECVRRLRTCGYEVFLPQESDVNASAEPTAKDIFRSDTARILESDVLVVCLDQETIDSGVACEVGLAYAFGIPIVGLYTDIRQYRSGRGRMYKNLYVLGAIEVFGKIVTNVNELLTLIPAYQAVDKDSINNVVRHFDAIATRYGDFVEQLESWYSPRWSLQNEVQNHIDLTHAMRILEIGCGIGKLGHQLCKQNPTLSYLGYDAASEMTATAKKLHTSERCNYTSDISRARSFGRESPIDLVLASFVLHDQPRKEKALVEMESYVKAGGHILTIDLSTRDLPRLVSTLKRGLSSPALIQDSRFEPTWILPAIRGRGIELVKYESKIMSIAFPSQNALEEYFEIFGIYRGMDLPLGLDKNAYLDNRDRLGNVIETIRFPFEDQRVFDICLLRKTDSIQAS